MTTIDPRDEPFPFYRTKVKDYPSDGQPFWLSIARAEDGLIHQRWDIRFETYAEALAAAQALIQVGAISSAFVNEEVAVVLRGA
jgi:hypothetical protein